MKKLIYASLLTSLSLFSCNEEVVNESMNSLQKKQITTTYSLKYEKSEQIYNKISNESSTKEEEK